MSLWTVSALAEAMGAERRGAGEERIDGISIDSRVIYQRDAFFAIKGETHDGHDFVDKALAGGAAVAVVSRAFAEQAPQGHYLVVDDVLEGLRRAGIAARARSKARIIAVTGSVGKTSTKEALREILGQQGRTHAAVASFNNHWGVPLTLARLPDNADFGIFEIGMNHAGEIEPLVKMVRPHLAIITNVEGVHLAHFKDVGEIADAKAEIFSGVETGGAVLLNRDNAHFAQLEARARQAGLTHIVTFGEAAAADARLAKVVLRADCSLIDATILGHDITYKIGAPGKHLAMNSLAVLAATVLVGADLAKAALALAHVEAVKGRGLRLTLHAGNGPLTVIDESYNANPVSMRAAFAVLAQSDAGLHGRRIAVIGDMLELGPDSAMLHAELASAIDASRIDLVYCCGPAMQALWNALPLTLKGAYAATSTDLAPKLLAAVQADDVVMVKGSLGSRMGPLVEALKARYSPLRPGTVI